MTYQGCLLRYRRRYFHIYIQKKSCVEGSNENQGRSKNNKIMDKQVFIPLLIGLSTAGLVSGLNPLYDIIHNERPLEFILFVTPIIFYVTNMRFTIGNLIHLASHEKKTNLLWRASWALMIFQHSTMIFLGGFTGKSTEELFFYILTGLLIVDIIWVTIAIIIGKKNGDEQRPHYGWAAINIFSIVVIFLLIFDIPYDLPSNEGLSVLFATFITVAIIDFIIIAHKHREKLRQESKEPNQN